jgi:hypothetical protein
VRQAEPSGLPRTVTARGSAGLLALSDSLADHTVAVRRLFLVRLLVWSGFAMPHRLDRLDRLDQGSPPRPGRPERRAMIACTSCHLKYCSLGVTPSLRCRTTPVISGAPERVQTRGSDRKIR